MEPTAASGGGAGTRRGMIADLIVSWPFGGQFLPSDETTKGIKLKRGHKVGVSGLARSRG